MSKNFFDFMFSNTKQQEEIKPQVQKAEGSSYGRPLTSIESAKDELFHSAVEFNPIEFIQDKKYFYGLDHFTGKPVYLNKDDVTHSLIVGPTRSGKGILLGTKVVEAIQRERGVIILAPKQDQWLIAVANQELEKQGREEDMHIMHWPGDFGYQVFSKTETPKEAAKKLTVMLNLIEKDDEAGASHYRKSERIMLNKTIHLFFNSRRVLGVDFELTLLNYSKFLSYIISDLQSIINYDKEFNKNKPRIDKIEEYSMRYFEPEKFDKCDFQEMHLQTLESLQFSISEFDDVSIYNKYTILDALKSDKVLYIDSDMQDETALKFLKLIITDIVQQAKRLGDCNTLVIADEVSFYPTPTLNAALATIAGFGVEFYLAYQDDGQLNDENFKAALKSNCQTKIYYKTSDEKTLNYIELLGGLEIVSQISKKENEITIRQQQEPYTNVTRLRAIPRQLVAVLIAESSNMPVIFQTAPVRVKEPFDWSEINERRVKTESKSLDKKYTVAGVKKQNSSVEKKNTKNSGDETVVSTEKFDI